MNEVNNPREAFYFYQLGMQRQPNLGVTASFLGTVNEVNDGFASVILLALVRHTLRTLSTRVIALALSER